MPRNLCLLLYGRWHLLLTVDNKFTFNHLWSLNTKAPHIVQFKVTFPSSPPSSLSDAEQQSKINISLLEGAEWKEKNKRRTPQSRQRVTRAPEQTTSLSRHPDKSPKTEHCGREECSSALGHITHSSGSWLTQPHHPRQDSDLTQWPP